MAVTIPMRILLAAFALVSLAGVAVAQPLSLLPPKLAAPAGVLKAPDQPAPAHPVPAVRGQEAGQTAPLPMPTPTPAHLAEITPADISAPASIATPAAAAAAAPLTAKSRVGEPRLNVVVFGDSLGDGLWAGLYHMLRKDKRFNVIRKSRVATGFVRKDYYDWSEGVRDAAADTRIDIAVVIIGTNDRQTIVADGARYGLFQPKWREVYNARVDDFTETLKASGATIYWVGLPVMRSAGFDSDMKSFTGIFKARAAANGVTFIPTHELMTDKEGNYSAYGADASGRKRLLRAEDGIHFSMQGYELLARTVGKKIVSDVESGAVIANASAGAVSSAAAEASEGAPNSVASIGLKAQIYDVAEGRPGRSDDWRWSGGLTR